MNKNLDIEEVASFEYIHRVYRVPAKIGGLIKFEGKLGTILGAKNQVRWRREYRSLSSYRAYKVFRELKNDLKGL